MQSVETYREAFIDYLKSQPLEREPKNLYQPIDYILNLGGKRLRPVLVLMACEAFRGHFKDALPAAMAIEVFHNFSLVHDDIMDDAPLRRGKHTVHEKWDVNTGILSGDAMLINAYQYLESYEGETLKKLLTLFSKTAVEVCEGQQYDVDFETRTDVTISEYLKMIEYKTSVLVAAALKMGAIIAGTTSENEELIYEFGRNLGIAFQLQDDYLDAFGDPKTFGKQVGGDIIENKKTFLYLKALELSQETTQKKLSELFKVKPENPSTKIELAKTIFQESGSVKALKSEIQNYTNKAFSKLLKIDANADEKSVFRQFGEQLMKRNS
jgi:geranylgeranyl diphosphate synthase type II